MPRKTITVPFNIKNTEINEKSNVFKFEGWAAAYNNIDRHGDVIMPGALSEVLERVDAKTHKVKILWQHDQSMPIGIPTRMIEKAEGLWVEGVLPLDDDFVAKRVVPQVKIGSVDSMSIGFTVAAGGLEYDQDHDLTKIHKISELWEFSLVTIPANQNAIVTSIKSIAKFEKGLKNITECEDIELAETLYLYNNEEIEVKKFPYGKELNGEKYIDIKALMDSCALIHCKKGTPEDKVEIDALKKTLRKYTTDAGLKDPVDNNGVFNISDLKLYTKRALENLLVSGVYLQLSNKKAKSLVASLNTDGRDDQSGKQRDAVQELQKMVEEQKLENKLRSILEKGF